MKKQLLVYSLWVISLFVQAQDQNPPDLLWKSIRTKNFEVIFPVEIEKSAQRVTNTLEWVFAKNFQSMHTTPKPVELILFNQSTNSNAYASLAPRYMGWYLTPPQSVIELGSTEWLQTLSLHEFRHIVQYSKNNSHFTKFMTYLFGDIGQVMMQWSIPDWFFEGDAIVMETALSNSGRGRLPSFSMYQRTYQLNGIKFKYDQAYLGSYKKFYPNHYYLGYPLTAYGRKNFGVNFWDNVLENTSRISFWPYAFATSVKKYSGMNTKKFYESAFKDLEKIWKEQELQIIQTGVDTVNIKKKKNWTNYYTPQFANSQNIIALKESLDKIPAFYILSLDGQEEKIKNTDAELFSLANNKILWARTVPDIRWGEQSYTDIIILDLKTRKEKRLSYKEKYLSPSLSPDGKKIAVVEFNTRQESNLCILDAANGKVIKKINIYTDYIRTPRWSSDGNSIVVAHSGLNGQAISMVNLNSDEIIKLEPYGWDNPGRPVFYKDFVLYNSDYSGIGNIYAINIFTKQKYQVTSRLYGAYNPEVDEITDKMIFQDYSKNGFDIAIMDLDNEKWIKIEQVLKTEPGYAKILAEQEGNLSLTEATINDSIYPIENYRKQKDVINIHSWGVFPYVPDLEISVLSNNILNTLSASAGYRYNTNEKTNTGFLNLSYAKFFPVLGFSASYGGREESTTLANDQFVTDRWSEFNTALSITVPLNLTRGVFYNNLSFRTAIGYTYTWNRELASPTRKPPGDFTFYSVSTNFSRIRQYAYRDFAPRSGQQIAISYSAVSPFSDKDGYLFSGQAGFYFPGIMQQHSLKLGGAFEKQESYVAANRDNLYYFASRVAFPRGYLNQTTDKFYKFTSDYQFPVWYPDINIGPLVYFKRFRAGVFYDYGTGYVSTSNYEYQSVGGSLMAEIKLLRINYPFEIGIQYAHRLTDGQNEYSFLIMGLPF
ncbi:MAG: hypothetical protein U0W24_25640 [Bacteroidales bacterium]